MSKVVIITGGTRGIGLGIAERFVAQDYQVALNYVSDQKNAELVQKKLGRENVFCIRADITQAEERKKLINEVIERFGGIDILINNAGIIRLGRITDLKEEDFKAVLQCNLHAPIFLAQEFANGFVD